MRVSPVLRFLAAMVVVVAAAATRAQAPAPAPDITVDDVRLAFTEVERAASFQQLLDAVSRHEQVLGDSRVLDLIDRLLESPGLGEAQRNFMLLERAIAHDIGRYGAATAAQLGAVRLIAVVALSAQSPAQLAAVMDEFAPLSAAMSPEVVRAALAAPENLWPPALLPLMEQLGQDWPAYGSQAAAMRMGEAAAQNAAAAGQSESESAGSWEDRTAESFLDMGQPIPDGLIYIPQQ
jgi:hypothetical protein